ncbi:unnamed protein product [Cylindrotheca closterium]|uniref:Uncharacterized protein n=1 Tax=Cylindrotheca closterium TaxID=2856 RepID=A0AAD2GA76_9STRA|nr:unnamed protein product [Cylindrotheca closterium]
MDKKPSKPDVAATEEDLKSPSTRRPRQRKHRQGGDFHSRDSSRDHSRESRHRSNDSRGTRSRSRDHSRDSHRSKESHASRDRSTDGSRSPTRPEHRDREAKRRTRGGRKEPSAAPGATTMGVVAVKDRRENDKRHADDRNCSGDLSALTKEERMSRRAREEQDAKRRAKEGRSVHDRSRNAACTATRESRDRDAKRRTQEGRSRGPAAPGVMSSSNRDPTEVRRKNKQQRHNGASRSHSAHHAKSLDSEPSKTVEPVATAAMGDDGKVAVEATAIDEEAEEIERMKALQEQNRALAQRVEQLVARNGEAGQVADKDKEAEEQEVQRLRAKKAKTKKRNICILVVLVLAIVSGVAGYLLSQKSSGATTPVETTGSEDSTNNDKTTAAPMVSVVESQPPVTSNVPEEEPSSAPTIQAYKAPSEEDCFRIKSGLPIDHQEQFEDRPFQIAFDITVKDPGMSTDVWVPQFKEGVDNILVPAMVGCDISRRRLQLGGKDDLEEAQPRLRKMSSTLVEQTWEPDLVDVDVDSAIRYVIANMETSIDPSRDVTADCAVTQSGCNNVKVLMQLFLKGEEKGFDIIALIAQILASLAAQDNNDNRRELESGHGQEHHRRLLANILGLDPDIFEAVGYRGIENVDPTTLPSISPSQVPSMVPSIVPSWVPSIVPSRVPSIAPSNEPTQFPTSGPSGTPSTKPTPGPTERPTSGPSPRPTPAPTLGPTPSPTPGPTSAPEPRPSLAPEPRPSLSPVPAPSYDPYGGPSYDPYGGGPSYDPYGEPSYDPYGGPSHDPYGGPSYDPYGGPSYDPYGGPPYDPYSGPSYEDPYSPGFRERKLATLATPKACTDDETWKDDKGRGCYWYQANDEKGCPNYGFDSFTPCSKPIGFCYPYDACCFCNQEEYANN